MTLVRRSDGQVRFLVRENLQSVDENIAECGNRNVILCTDDYRIYNEIDDFDAIDGHLAVNQSETYMIGDIHMNMCENRHGFVRQWLERFRDVSKHHLQRYLDFLDLQLNAAKDWFRNC